jgi:hypothetical protein
MEVIILARLFSMTGSVKIYLVAGDVVESNRNEGSNTNSDNVAKNNGSSNQTAKLKELKCIKCLAAKRK